MSISMIRKYCLISHLIYTKTKHKKLVIYYFFVINLLIINRIVQQIDGKNV